MTSHGCAGPRDCRDQPSASKVSANCSSSWRAVLTCFCPRRQVLLQNVNRYPLPGLIDVSLNETHPGFNQNHIITARCCIVSVSDVRKHHAACCSTQACSLPPPLLLQSAAACPWPEQGSLACVQAVCSSWMHVQGRQLEISEAGCGPLLPAWQVQAEPT